VVFSIATSVLKADQRSARVSSLTVLDKLGRLTLIVAVVFTVGATASHILYVAVFVEVVVLCVALYWCRQYLVNTRPTLSAPTLRPMVLFGIPLMAKELVGVLLETGDKYIIQGYLGGEALGHYSAAVNVTMYLEWVLLLALDNTIVPQYLVHFGALTITGAGAFLLKKPKPLLIWTCVALVFNFGFNLLTVPIWGIEAAAVVTCIASLLQFFGVQWSFRTRFPVALPWAVMCAGLVSALAALMLTAQIRTDHALIDLMARGTAAVAIYCVLMLMISQRARTWLAVALKRAPPSAVDLG